MDAYTHQLAEEVLAATAGYEIVVVYADFRFLIDRPAIAAQRNAFFKGLFESLSASGKTYLTPSYSYTTSGDFRVESTRTNTSALAKWMLTEPGVMRSDHPLFSYLGFGPRTAILGGIAKSAFGEDSLYDRLRSHRAGFLHLGRPIQLGNTMVHHVEHMCGATYRLHKTFATKVYRGDNFVGTDYTAFVRRQDVENEDFAFRFDVAADALMAAGFVDMVAQSPHIPYLAAYPLDKARKVLVDLFHHDPTVFVRSQFQQY